MDAFSNGDLMSVDPGGKIDRRHHGLFFFWFLLISQRQWASDGRSIAKPARMTTDSLPSTWATRGPRTGDRRAGSVVAGRVGECLLPTSALDLPCRHHHLSCTSRFGHLPRGLPWNLPSKLNSTVPAACNDWLDCCPYFDQLTILSTSHSPYSQRRPSHRHVGNPPRSRPFVTRLETDPMPWPRWCAGRLGDVSPSPDGRRCNT